MRNLILTELKLRSVDWANVSGKYLNRAGVSITRGRSATGGPASPSQSNITLDNTGGVFSPRNPGSPIAGEFGRNTPLRVSVVEDEASKGLVLARGGNGNLIAGDTAGTSVTGDLDLRVDLELLDDGDPDSAWKWPTAGFDLASKWFPGTLSWAFLIIGGVLHFRWSQNGTAGLTANATTALAGPDKGRRALRVTIDVNNGSGGRMITFYQAPTIAGPWTLVGAPVVQATGTTAIFDGTANLRVGAAAQADAWTWGRSGPVVVYDFQMRNISGELVADPQPKTRPIDPVPFGSSSWTDAQGNTWFLAGGPDAARIWYGKTWIRHVGEVAEWPPRWDPSHSDKYVPLTANGILRRLNQGKAPAATSLRDYILQPGLVDALAFYTPLNGAEGTTYSLNLAPSHYYLQTRLYGWAYGAQVPVFTYGQDMGAAWIGTGLQINATGLAAMIGDPATADQNCALDFVFQSNSLGVFTIEMEDYSYNKWSLVLDTPTNDGTLQVSFLDPNVGPIGFATQGPFTELQDVNLHHCRFQLTKAGSDTQFAVYIDGVLRSSGTMAGYMPNGWARFAFLYTRYVNQTYVNIAHVAAWANANAAEIPPIADMVAAAFGYAGETAGDRIERVCADGGIALTMVGDPATTTVMGPQVAEPRLSQIRDAEQTDFGILTEPREELGLLYRSRASMYAQTPAVTIDYSARVVAPPFEPVDDDQTTRNNVTATRRDGGSYQVKTTTGPMSVLDPPDGIGQYEDEVTVNVQTDAQLPGAASWWMRLGTLDAARFDSVTFNLGAQEIRDNPTLKAAILALDVGDRMVITNITAADIPDTVDLIIQGSSEEITNTSWTITFPCAPGLPYQVAKFDTARFDADTSVLTAALTAGATTFQVNNNGQTKWTVDPAMFPFDVNIDGERITVGGITGAGPQTFNPVTRSVNGVVKTHAAGATVRLWDTPRFAY